MIGYVLDTNVLVYCIDETEPDKQRRAIALLDRLGASGGQAARAAVPAQVLGEFVRVATGRLKPPPSHDTVVHQIELYEQSFRVLPLTAAVVHEAARGLRDHRFAYYDAQIWAAARLNQVPVVLSEDFASGSTVEGITFVNPFAPAFDPGAL